MKIIDNFPLEKYITLNMKGISSKGVIVDKDSEIVDAIKYAKENSIPFRAIGSGSNIYIPQFFDGLIIVIGGGEFTKTYASAGVLLDEFIQNTKGMENLSHIPGTVGGAIVQNAGAYGVEIKDFIDFIEVYDTDKDEVIKLNDCEFSYRDSIFKRNKNLIILSTCFNTSEKLVVNYKGLENVKDREELRKRIIELRKLKFGGYKNKAGSFFKNLILKEKPKDLPFFKIDGGYKVSLAYVMDKVCGLNGYSKGNLKLSEKNPIVVVTTGKTTKEELESFIVKVKSIIKDKTGFDVKNEVVEI